MNPSRTSALNPQPRRRPANTRVLAARPSRRPAHPARAIAVPIGPSRRDLAPAPMLLKYLLRRLAGQRTLPQARHSCREHSTRQTQEIPNLRTSSSQKTHRSGTGYAN